MLSVLTLYFRTEARRKITQRWLRQRAKEMEAKWKSGREADAGRRKWISDSVSIEIKGNNQRRGLLLFYGLIVIYVHWTLSKHAKKGEKRVSFFALT